MNVEKVFVYGKHGIDEYPITEKNNIEMDIQLWNRGRAEADHKNIIINDVFPPSGLKLQTGVLVKLSMAEQEQAGLIILKSDQKLLDGVIINKTEKEQVIDSTLSTVDFINGINHKIESLYTSAMLEILGQYTESEIKGWEKKEREARGWIAADATLKAQLEDQLGIAIEANQIAGATTADIESLAQSIVAKADLYWKYYHTLTGIKNATIKNIKDIPTTPLVEFYEQTMLLFDNINFPKITEI